MKRQRKWLIFLVIVSLVIFVYVRKEIVFQQAKRLIKQNLERSLPCNLAIEKLRAGLFYGLVLEDLELNFPQISGLVLNIKVDQARIDYNLWQNIFSGHEDVRQLRLISPEINLAYLQDSLPIADMPKTAQQFALKDFELVLENGQISFGDDSTLFKDLQGKLLLTKRAIYFQDIKAIFAENSQEALRVHGELTAEGLSLTAHLEHLKVANFDILTNLVLTLNRRVALQEDLPKLSGTLKTYGSVVNNQPFAELNSFFEIQDRKLRILTFSLGQEYDLRGIVDLTPPFNADLSLNFNQAALDKLILQFGHPAFLAEEKQDGFNFSEQLDFSGLLNGLIKITGALNHPKIEGYLEAKQGHIGNLSFVGANINIKGRYPKILIVDSQICREEDFFIMEGEIDLSNLSSSHSPGLGLEKQDPFDIRFKSDKGMFWQGWDITRMRDNQVHMSKNIADDFKITFDTFTQAEDIDLEGNYENELGLEYRIFGDKLLKLRLKKEEEILGLERRVKF